MVAIKLKKIMLTINYSCMLSHGLLPCIVIFFSLPLEEPMRYFLLFEAHLLACMEATTTSTLYTSIVADKHA